MAKMANCSNRECFAYWEGSCRSLSKNNFKNKKCPFFASKEEVKWEDLGENCREYMKNRGGEYQ